MLSHIAFSKVLFEMGWGQTLFDVKDMPGVAWRPAIGMSRRS